MFYHPLLLHHQHKMQLSMPWLAATVGLKKLKKPGILECDTSKLCTFILQFLKSDSRDPQKRLSLRLSTMLVHGTVLIWRQQVIFLGEDCSQFIIERQKMNIRLKEHLREDKENEYSPTPQPIVKKKRAKPHAIEETPESILSEGVRREKPEISLEPLSLADVLKDQAITQARVDEITLREEAPKRQEELQPMSDDFGEMGMMLPPPPIPSVEVPRRPSTITVEAEVHAPPMAQEPAQPSIAPVTVEEQPQIMEQVPEEAPVITHLPPSPKEKEAVPEKVIEKEKGAAVEEAVEKSVAGEKEVVAEKPAEQEVRKAAEGQEWPMLVEPVEPQVLKVAAKKARSIAAQLLVKRHRKRFVAINQKLQLYDDEDDFADLRRETTKRLPDFVPMKKFWPEWEEGIVQRAAVDEGVHEPRTTGTSASLELQMDTPSLGSIGLSVPQDVSTGPGYASTPVKRPLPVDETVIDVMPPAANGLMAPPKSPAKRRKIVSVEKPKEVTRPMEEMMIEAEKAAAAEQTIGRPIEMEIEAVQVPPSVQVEIAPVPEEPMEEIVPPKEKDEKQTPPKLKVSRGDYGIKWSNRIMRVVYKHTKVGPVDICKELNKRLTKLNMAIIFNSLLALAKARFVQLNSGVETLELETIEKGPREFFVEE